MCSVPFRTLRTFRTRRNAQYSWAIRVRNLSKLIECSVRVYNSPKERFGVMLCTHFKYTFYLRGGTAEHRRVPADGIMPCSVAHHLTLRSFAAWRPPQRVSSPTARHPWVRATHNRPRPDAAPSVSSCDAGQPVEAPRPEAPPDGRPRAQARRPPPSPGRPALAAALQRAPALVERRAQQRTGRR